MSCQSVLRWISSAKKIKMTTHIQNYNTKKADLKPKWHVIDAKDRTLGRISTEIAILLQGKHKPSYTPNLLTGDFVVVVNADKFKVTGNKLSSKKYYRHSGYIGGLTEQTMEEMLNKFPERVITQSVKGMLPKNKLGRKMLLRLKVYAGDQHPHEAQIRETIDELQQAVIVEPEAKPKAKVETKPKAKIETKPKAKVEAKPKAKIENLEDINLADLTIPKLKELASSKGLTVPSKARKVDIIEIINSKTD